MEEQILAILNDPDLTVEQKAKAIYKLFPVNPPDLEELIDCINSGGFCFPSDGENLEKVCFIYSDGGWHKASGKECDEYLNPWKYED